LILIEEETKLQEILDINPVIEEAQEEGDPKKVPNPHLNVCDLDDYQYLRYINLSNNELSSIKNVMKLPYLLEIVAKTNQIASLDFLSESPDALKFLQKVDLSANKITVLPHIHCANLYKLILDENEIAKSELKSH